jgi:hypothetical protein
MATGSQASSVAFPNLSQPSGGTSDDILDLLRLRAHLREQLVRGREALGKLSREFERVDADIHRLTGTPRKVEIERSQISGDFSLLVLGVLENAQRPLNAREVARKIMSDQGFDADDKDLRTRILRRVNVCLWTQTQKGRLRQSQPKTNPIKWELANPQQDKVDGATSPWHSAGPA